MKRARQIAGIVEIRKGHIILPRLLVAKRTYLKTKLNWILKNYGVTLYIELNRLRIHWQSFMITGGKNG
jgi:hypothetical protein